MLAAQLLVGVVILNIYFIRRRTMEDNAVQKVSFERLGSTDYHESETRVTSPGKAEVNIRSSAGSGGYAMMVVDVLKNDGNRATREAVTSLPGLSVPEVKGRLELPVKKHGVTAARPTIKAMEPRPGAAQLYTGTIEVERPGDYTVIYAQLRPWQPNEHKIYYVVHVHAD